MTGGFRLGAPTAASLLCLQPDIACFAKRLQSGIAYFVKVPVLEHVPAAQKKCYQDSASVFLCAEEGAIQWAKQFRDALPLCGASGETKFEMRIVGHLFLNCFHCEEVEDNDSHTTIVDAAAFSTARLHACPNFGKAQEQAILATRTEVRHQCQNCTDYLTLRQPSSRDADA
eukprot:scaffold27441_cov23-Tisochrysis_lutea.AAC.1